MSKIKEFEELPLGSSYLINAFKTNDKFSMAQTEYIEQAQKDAWNAAIKWAAENAEADYKGMAEVWVDKQSILKGLIDD